MVEWGETVDISVKKEKTYYLLEPTTCMAGPATVVLYELSNSITESLFPIDGFFSAKTLENREKVICTYYITYLKCSFSVANDGFQIIVLP